MLSASVPGKLYLYWTQSVCFAVFAAAARFFSRAWKGSFLRSLLVRGSSLGKLYRKSRICAALNGITRTASSAAGRLSRKLAPFEESSSFARLCRGSAVFKMRFVLGAFFLVMYALPHSAWRNWYALAAAVVLFAAVVFKDAGRRDDDVNEGGSAVLAGAGELGFSTLLFAASCVISLLCSEAAADSLRVLAFFAAAFLLMWTVFSAVRREEDVKSLLGWIYAAVMAVSAAAVAQAIAGVAPSASQTDMLLNAGLPGRVYSTLENPNNLAEFLVMFSPLCAVCAGLSGDCRRRLALSLGLCLPVAALLMTYSRSGWLSAALTVVLFVYFRNRRLLPLLFFLGLLCVPLLPSGVLLRLSNLLNPADTSADYRLRIWETFLRLLSDQRRFITGIGPGTKTLAAQIALFADDYVLAGIVHSQMLYIELLAEFGIVGLVSGVLMTAAPAVRALNVMYKCKDSLCGKVLAACVSSLAGMALFGLFEYIWFYPRILFGFFMLLGLTKAVSRMAEEA